MYRFEDYFFNERLDSIEVSAFHRCNLLQSINIPRYVRVIEKGAFESCHGLMMADLGKGLEIIGAGAFNACSSLHHINIPGGVRSIQNLAFSYCSRLTALVLNNGLRVIEKFAFTYCIKFCIQNADEVLVESRCPRKVLKYLLLSHRDNIPMRVRNVTQNRWYINIHNMLERIPSIAEDNSHLYFDLISIKLQLYSTLKDVPALLELVMWKLTIVTKFDENDNFDILSADEKNKC